MRFQARIPAVFVFIAVSLTVAMSFAVGAMPIAAGEADPSYRAAVEKWRQAYEAELKSDHGWLSISGLFWLHEGENDFGSDPLNDIVLPESSAPANAGYFDVHDGMITVHIKPGVAVTMNGAPVTTAEMVTDAQPVNPQLHANTATTVDRLVLGSVMLWIHSSGNRLAVRLRDKNSKLRQSFTGLHWFPVDESYRVTARYFPYAETKPVEIQNLVGDTLKLPITGYVTFTLNGQELRLEAESDQTGALTFVFRDLTSGKETYAAARFLDTETVKNGQVTLDFNEAYNPPCAYNPYTTCPLPPPGNRLHVRIEAGELAYHH